MLCTSDAILWNGFQMKWSLWMNRNEKQHKKQKKPTRGRRFIIFIMVNAANNTNNGASASASASWHYGFGVCVYVCLHSRFSFPLALLPIGLISCSFGLYLSASRMQMKLFQLLCLRRVLCVFCLHYLIRNRRMYIVQCSVTACFGYFVAALLAG